MKNGILAVLFASLLPGLSPLAAESVIRRGIDVFTTPADGRTYYDFAQSPIPAGFFCKSSRAFTGRVAFKGLSLATEPAGQLWGGDTVVERLDDAVFDARGTARTRIQLRALSLVSTAPVKTACGDFHVYVTLGGRQRVTTMSIRRAQEGDGSFVAPLAVNARISFIPVKPERNKDLRRLELTASFTFPADPLPWSLADVRTKRIGPAFVDTDGDLSPDTLLLGASSFSPGVSPDHLVANKSLDGGCSCSELTCHAGDGEEHCYYPPPPPECQWTICGNSP
ncbi:MAG: hypothetical protein ACJ76Y_22625 [Thermoanaerobaculia bacterium]